ncbi:MAG TPA: hypothetical protein VNX60_05030 [Candidatus Acidoferrum sp.]|nr:hypothetical protein [Candidatus Acidoferrum sp.]
MLTEPKPHADGGPQPQIPSRAAARCSGDRNCPFPPIADGLCRGHLRDRQSEYSPVGCAAASLICAAPVHVESAAPKSYCRQWHGGRTRKIRTQEEMRQREKEQQAKAHAWYVARRAKISAASADDSMPGRD